MLGDQQGVEKTAGVTAAPFAEELAWEDICPHTQLPFVRSPHLHGCPGGRDGASGFPEEHCLWYSRFFKFYKITSWFHFLFL